VALFAGMAAAMVVPRVRRSVPSVVEGIIWLGLIVACWMAITHVEQANVRYLTESAAWGADQIINTTIALMFAAMFAWIGEHRFVIANVVVLMLGADMLALALVRGYRQAESSLPRIKLGEWIEIPLHHAPAIQPAVVPYAMEEWNRRAERAAAMLAAAFLVWFVQMLFWTRDVVVPRARARQALAVSGLAVRAGIALDKVAIGQSGLAGLGDQNLTDDQVIDIHTLMGAQSIGWYGPVLPAPDARALQREEGSETEPDRLAS
jgi:hypothetical protein